MKSTSSLITEPKLGFQHPHGVFQLVSLVPGYLMPSSDLCGLLHAYGVYMHMLMNAYLNI